MSKIKVLHISTADSWRGGEQQLAYLLDELKDKCENHVLCRSNSAMEKHCQKQGYLFNSLNKRFSLDPGFAMGIKSYCDENAIDLIHTHDSHAHSMCVLAASLFGNNVPLIASRRVDFPIQKSWFSHFKYNHQIVKKILCVSDEIKRITARGIKDESLLQTVYSGIDLQKFSPRSGKLRKDLGIGEDQFIIGNTSALADHKDYFTFIRAAEHALKVDPKLLFLIIGNGPKESEIASFMRSRNLGDAIRMIGFRKDIPEVLADLDLFMITSKTEGLGTSILDAFASGVPVLATEAGGIPEIVIDGKSGLLCEVEDHKCLSEKLLELKAKAELREKLVKGAKEKVQEFSKSTTAQNTFLAYQDVLASI